MPPTLYSVSIKVYPRVHIGLLSMHIDAPRMNGGIGFSVKAPIAKLDIYAAERTEICDNRLNPMGMDEQAQLLRAIRTFADRHRILQNVHIKITGGMRTHVGMGSATAIRLGSIEGYAILNGLQLTRDALTKASGRGGTSGVGVNSYFEGGMICDLGRASNGAPHAPSSIVYSPPPPLALPMIEMPSWPVLLCIPRAIPPKTQLEEIAFFSRATPLPASASFKACYIALFSLYAAIRECNYTAFCEGVDAMQNTDWKRAECAEYGEGLTKISDALKAHGADCVGMSSLGPMLFCFAPTHRMEVLESIAHMMDCDSYLTTPANQGREVNYDNA